MKTAIIGAIFVDVKGFSAVPYAPTGTNIGTVHIMHGGVCRNVCEDFGNQGEEAAFVSMTDNTALGRDVRERLARTGVDLKHMLFSEEGMGLWLAILDEHGDLVGSISKQPDFSPLEEYLRAHIDEILQECGSVVLEIDTSATIAEIVLDSAERLGKPVYVIVANLGVIANHTEYLGRVRCFICNNIEAGKLLGKDLTHKSPFELLDTALEVSGRFRIPSVVVTMGDQGAVYYDSVTGEAGHCPPIPTHMVDSTGAGDAFFAGTVMALNRHRPLWQAVRVGTQLASATLACDQSSCARIEGLLD
ncbi:MAG: sugar kinase [Clostridia bacterium]|nr:sugar kinase [Clostridia bacterium]